MAKAAGGKGEANNPMVSVQNNTAPTTPEAIAAYQAARSEEAKAQAQRAVDGARSKVAQMQAHLDGAETEAKRERQLEHLVGAEEALAQALAEQKGLA